jgi:hypothetical protein
MQQKELELKSREVDIKEKKLAVDAATKADQMDIERDRIASQKEIAGMQVGAKVANERAQLSAKQQTDGARIGVEIARDLSAKESK